MKFDIFISYRRIIQMLEPGTFDLSLALLWLFYGTLTWVRNALLDEPSGRLTYGRLFQKGLKKAERKEDSMVMPEYTMFTNIGSSAYEAGLISPHAQHCRFALQRTYVHDEMNMCCSSELYHRYNS